MVFKVICNIVVADSLKLKVSIKMFNNAEMANMDFLYGLENGNIVFPER